MRLPTLVAMTLAIAHAPTVAQELPDHSTFAAVLSAHNHHGFVDYEAISADRTGLDKYIQEFGSTSPVVSASVDRFILWTPSFFPRALRSPCRRCLIDGARGRRCAESVRACPDSTGSASLRWWFRARSG